MPTQDRMADETPQSESEVLDRTPFGDRLTALIIEASPDLIYIYDRLEERYLFFNSNSIPILGYAPAELLGMRGCEVQKWIHPEDLAHVQVHYAKQEHLCDADVSMAEYRVRHAAGHYKLIRCRQKVFSRTADGKPKCILGIGTDITDETRRKSELERLRVLIPRTRSDERDRIALRLHDTAMQHLVGSALLLERIKTYVDDEKALSALGEVRASLSKTLQAILEPLRDGRPNQFNSSEFALCEQG